MNDPDRRQFLQRTGQAACAVALGATAIVLGRRACSGDAWAIAAE